MKDLSIVIYAAGRGTRLGAGFPKFLTEVEGQPLFAHQLRALRAFSSEIYVVCGYRASVLCPLVIDSKIIERGVSFVYNSQYLKPQIVSIHRVLESIPLDRPAIFIDGDMLFTSDLIGDLIRGKNDTVVIRKDISPDSVIATISNDRITRFSRSSGGSHEWGNIAYYTAESLRLLPDILLSRPLTYHYELVNELILRRGPSQWRCADLAEIDEPADVARAAQFLRSRGLSSDA